MTDASESSPEPQDTSEYTAEHPWVMVVNDTLNVVNEEIARRGRPTKRLRKARTLLEHEQVKLQGPFAEPTEDDKDYYKTLLTLVHRFNPEGYVQSQLDMLGIEPRPELPPKSL